MKWLQEILDGVESKDDLIKDIKKGIGENFVARNDFNAKNDEIKALQSTIQERDGQLEELKKIDHEGLKAQIAELQQTNSTQQTEYEKALKDAQVAAAIKLSLKGIAHDEDLVTSLIDREKLVLDGEKVVGLSDQLEKLQEEKKFLFISNEEPKGGFRKIGQEPKDYGSDTDTALDEAFGINKE